MRTVVLGGGIAGLCAAAALSAAGSGVLVIEQDEIPTRHTPRGGVPQSRQLHNLLGRAQLHLNSLFPGFTERVLAHGGTRAAVSSETHVFELGVPMPERNIGISILSAAQPAIEHTARALLPSRVEHLHRTKALGLVIADGAVRGVDTSAGPIAADMVVDALGARSPVSGWLPEQPQIDVVESRHWYTTLSFERPAHHRGRPDFWLTFPTAPRTRGGLLSPDGPERWRASVSGVAGDPVPTSVDTFAQYVRSLETDSIASALGSARAIGRPVTFQRPAAQWRRYDKQVRPVAGLLPVGDAFAVLNPLLGQGISVAAWQATGLPRQLPRRESGDVSELTARYVSYAGECIRPAWQLTKIFNPGADPDVPILTDDDWQKIATAVHGDPDAHSRYVRVWHLLEPVSTLATLAGAQGEPS